MQPKEVYMSILYIFFYRPRGIDVMLTNNYIFSICKKTVYITIYGKNLQADI